jgi:hypothetical protein
MDSILEEGLVTATAAFRALGIRVSIWSILRWIRRGVRKRRLEAVKVGGRWFTSVAAVKRFLASSTPKSHAGVGVEVAAPAVERYLRSIGLGRERSRSE